LDARMAPYREGSKNAEMAKAGIKTGFKRRVSKTPSYSKRSLSSTIRLIVIILLLLAITVVFLRSSLIADFVQAMES